MMKKLISVLAMGALYAFSAMAETDYIAMPIIQDIQKGVNNQNQITTLRASGAGTIGSSLTVGTSIAAGTKVTSYTYAVDVGPTNNQVFMTHKGSISANGVTTSTNAFAPVFIETPVVIWRYTTAGIAATNPITVASNSFTITAIQTNGEYIARGRVK